MRPRTGLPWMRLLARAFRIDVSVALVRAAV